MLFEAIRRAVVGVILLSGIVLMGCGNADLVSARGLVTLDGTPLENAEVIFSPTGGEGATSGGVTDSQGRFELYYPDGSAGASPGEHSVQIFKYRKMPAHSEESGQMLPAIYNDESKLSAVVKNEANDFKFELESSP